MFILKHTIFKDKNMNRTSHTPKYSSYASFMTDKQDKNRMCTHLLSKEHKNRIVRTNKVVIVDLFAEWCGPCKTIAPLFDELMNEYNSPGKVFFCKENIDLGLSPKLMSSGRIQGVPSFVFYVNGNIVDIVTGAHIDLVKETLMKHLEKVKSV